jgi:hypothetical protein
MKERKVCTLKLLSSTTRRMKERKFCTPKLLTSTRTKMKEWKFEHQIFCNQQTKNKKDESLHTKTFVKKNKRMKE